MADAAERLVNLALYLGSTRRPVTAEQCRGAGLGYPDGQDDAAFIRMFERDKDALRAAGFVIDVSSTDPEAYTINAEASFARPVDLTTDELAALHAVAAAFIDDADFPFHDDLALAVAKLGTTPAGHERPQPAALAPAEHAETAARVRLLAEAVQARKLLTFGYTNASGEARTRTVEPYGIFHREGRWYVSGRDCDAGATRTFLTTRMADLTMNRNKPRTPDFERPDGYDVRTIEALPFQMGPAALSAVVRFEPAVAWRAERLARGHGTLGTHEDGSVTWTVEAAGVARLASWIIEEGPGISAEAPPELRQALADGLRKAVSR